MTSRRLCKRLGIVYLSAHGNAVNAAPTRLRQRARKNKLNFGFCPGRLYADPVIRHRLQHLFDRRWRWFAVHLGDSMQRNNVVFQSVRNKSVKQAGQLVYKEIVHQRSQE